MAVRLSSNESAYGPSPRAVEAIRAAAEQVHLYPDDQSVALREAIGALEGVPATQVTVGTGSAALLMDLVGHECQEGGEVLAFERAFIVYRLGARNAGVPYVEAPTQGPATGTRDGYARDPAALLSAVTDRTRVVLIDNPGNPTGAHLDADALGAVIEGVPDHVTVAVDEAYWQFAEGERGYARARDLGVEHPRLVVLSTFSKAYALAGLRVGYAVGPVDVVQPVDAWRARFNVNVAGQRAAIAALEDRDHLARTVAGTREGRRRMAAGLRELGIPFTDGLGNFLTLELGQPAAPVVAAYAEHGVGVRPLAPYGMDEQVRVSVGTPDEIDAFLAASDEVLADVASRS